MNCTFCFTLCVLFLIFRSTLVSLPDVVLVNVLSYIQLQDLLTIVNRTCKKLNHLIKTRSFLWRNFDFDWDLHLKYDVICEILSHSARFVKLYLPRDNFINCPAPDIDYLFLTRFLPAKNLYLISMIDNPVSTLSFLKYTPNVQIVDFSGCHNLRDDDFLALLECKELDQIYVSFTDISPKTLCAIVKGKSVTVLDACAVEFDINECKQILSQICVSLLSFNLSLKEGVEIHDFNREIRDLYIDNHFHIYLNLHG